MISSRSVLILVILSLILTSCKVSNVYTSASYGGLRTYTVRPIYDGEKEISTYASGSMRYTTYPQHYDVASKDEVIAGNFSIYQVHTNEGFSYYYGLAGSYGEYRFNSDLIDNNIGAKNFINKGERLEHYNINLKTGIDYSETWGNYHFNVIGLELLYADEHGSYIDKLDDIRSHQWSWEEEDALVVANERSIYAFDVNTELTYIINPDNNIGLGLFVGDVLFNDKSKTRGRRALIRGLTFKYEYKKFCLNYIYERSTRHIRSSRVGITYRLFNRHK